VRVERPLLESIDRTPARVGREEVNTTGLWEENEGEGYLARAMIAARESRGGLGLSSEGLSMGEG
jgi:hypothetical protein